MATTTGQIQWRTDLDSALKDAKGQLVLLDFSAAPM